MYVLSVYVHVPVVRFWFVVGSVGERVFDYVLLSQMFFARVYV